MKTKTEIPKILFQALLCSILLFSYKGVNAQEEIATSKVIMNDGAEYAGQIIENVLNCDYFVLRLPGNELKKIYRKDVAAVNQISQKPKADIDVCEYGSRFSLGAAIGGGGIIGIPMRVFLHRNIPFELGIHLRPVMFQKSSGSIGLSMNVLFTGEFDFFFNRKYIERKQRVRMNGIFIKGGYSTGIRYNSVLGAIGWQYERFKVNKKNRSFSAGLGIGFERAVDKTYHSYYGDKNYQRPSGAVSISPMIYWKFAWNFFIPSIKNKNQ